MNKRPIDEEVSALLDGEADDPKAVRERLRRDPALARRFEEYKRLSERLKAVPQPDVHPAFAARVAAAAADDQRRRRMTWRLWLGAALPAAAALLVALGAFLFWPEEPAPRPRVPEGLSAVTAGESDILFLALEERVEEDAVVDTQGLGVAYGLPGDPHYAVDALGALLEEENWLDGILAATSSPFETERLVEILDDEERRELRSLLMESLEGGQTT